MTRRLPPRSVELAFLATLSACIALLGLGVLQHRRWRFWLIVVAFLFGVLRVPATILELTGALPAAGPTWYVLVQALVGLLQCAIGLGMLAGYRRAGIWGGLKPVLATTMVTCRYGQAPRTATRRGPPLALGSAR
jgi:hypothetical protein